jgi:lipopolysaccharide transport system ATP-binding protein
MTQDSPFPAGAIVGVIGEDGSGQAELVSEAGGRRIGPGDALNLAPAPLVVIEHALALHDDVVRARAIAGLERLRRAGSTVLIVSHDQELLRSICDEVWWTAGGRVEARGDPREILERYNRHIAAKLSEWGRGVSGRIPPAFRRGDGRARLLAIETLDAEGRATMVWTSGKPAAVRVRVRFENAVEDPVVGIMIRTRIGLEVFGTNTELEGRRFGPCGEGETVRITFRFACHLCPQQYTVTAASHDPDGVWHDWMEDAVAFSVADARYTAGVANLRASVDVERE